jgi:hypothetical protein
MAPADEMLLEQEPTRLFLPQLATPKPRTPAAAKPEMNRQERLISTAYLVMIVMVVAFLAVTGLVAWLLG